MYDFVLQDRTETKVTVLQPETGITKELRFLGQFSHMNKLYVALESADFEEDLPIFYEVKEQGEFTYYSPMGVAEHFVLFPIFWDSIK